MLSFVVCSLRYSFESNVGLSFLGAGIGNVLGSLVSGHVSDCLIKKARARRGGLAKTEDRLTLNAWYIHIYLLAASLRIYANHQTRPGGYIIVPMGVLLFGWSVYLQWTVWVSIVAFGTVCFGMSQGMVSCVTFAQLLLTANSNQKQYFTVYAAGSAYLVDAIPGKGASVTAASNVVRMGMACILSLIAEPVVQTIGPGYLSVILAALNILGISLYSIVKIKGQTLRQRAGFGENHE